MAVAKHQGGPVEIWGDGEQTRSFMFIEDCLDGLERIMAAEELNNIPVNLGRDRMVSINELATIIGDVAGFEGFTVEHVDGALGVRGRNSDNTFLNSNLDWTPGVSLEVGLAPTYEWIEQMAKAEGLLG
jgi:nucleoside-diphosphate-sugar epimerase